MSLDARLDHLLFAFPALKGSRYTSEVLRPMALPYLRGLRNFTFQQGNERSHVARIVLTFLDKEHVRLLPWPTRFPDRSPLENIWAIVFERLARHHSPVTMIDELWCSVEAALTTVFVHNFQSLFQSMPRRISAVISTTGGSFEYRFLRIYTSKFPKTLIISSSYYNVFVQ